VSIIAYTGLPGHGKSYGVVEHVILPALRSGRVVWSNIPLHADHLAQEIPGAVFHQIEDFSDDTPAWVDGTALSAVPKGAVLVLDEAWKVLPSGMKANHVPACWKRFFAEHRHNVGEDGFSTEIVLVTQDLADVASFARNKVEKTFIVRKLWTLGAANRFIVDCYSGSVSGQRGPEARKVGVVSGQYRAEVYAFYRSHTKGDGQVGVEAVPDKRGVIWRHPMVMFGIPLALAATAASVYLGFGFVRNITGDKQALVAPKVEEFEAPSRPLPAGKVAPASVELVEPEPEPGPKYSKRWRIAAVIAKETGEGLVLLLDEARMTRYYKLDECEQTGPLPDDIACIVDGLLATTFTGSNGGWLPALASGMPSKER
jgi:zona occludens toxin (predicted ATPase)